MWGSAPDRGVIRVSYVVGGGTWPAPIDTRAGKPPLHNVSTSDGVFRVTKGAA